MADLGHVAAQFFDLGGRAFDEASASRDRPFRPFVKPVGIKFRAAIGVDEFAAVDPRLVGQFHHELIDRHDPAVDAVKLVNQRFDPVVVQVQFDSPVHTISDAQLLVLAFFLFEKRSSSFSVADIRLSCISDSWHSRCESRPAFPDTRAFSAASIAASDMLACSSSSSSSSSAIGLPSASSSWLGLLGLLRRGRTGAGTTGVVLALFLDRSAEKWSQGQSHRAAECLRSASSSRQIVIA